MEIGAEELSPRVLTAESISEVSKYDFEMKNLTVTPKHVKLPKNDKDSCGIEGLENISNPFKIVSILYLPKITEIGSIASRQSRAKKRKSDLSGNPKFPFKEQQSTSSGDSSEQSDYEATIKSSQKRLKKNSVKKLKQSDHEDELLLVESEPERLKRDHH